MQSAPETLATPEFARVEIRMTDKAGLAAAARQLRTLASDLDNLASGTMADPIANYVAWGTIKSASKRLRD